LPGSVTAGEGGKSVSKMNVKIFKAENEAVVWGKREKKRD
jgi:hypothetical protein